MSVISESSHRRSSQKPFGRSRHGFSGSRSVAGYELGHERRHLLPYFSAAASEGVKLDMHDGDWGDNTTVITANTSEHSFNGGLVEQLQIQPPKSRPGVRRCSQLCWALTTFLISFAALVSGPLMAAAPFIATYLGFEWPAIQCEIDCQGNLLAMFIMSVLLVIFFWLTYWRRAPALMPRLFVPRAGFSLFVLFILFAFWLFYATRILIERYPTYPHIVWFALALVLTLLVVNVIWIVHNFLQLRPAFYVTIIRDPDGESHTSEIGQMSIQEAAVQVLRDYHTLFSTYNPYMDRLKTSEGGGRFRGGGGPNVNAITGMKVYDIDGTGQAKLSQDEAKLLMVAAARRRANGHNDLFYDEMDRDKREKKRRYRLMDAATEAFAHVQSVNTNNANFKMDPMTPQTMARIVMGMISKPLSRYLKFTKQKEYYPPEVVITWLEKCLQHGFSARTFLQPFLSNRAPSKDPAGETKWSVVCHLRSSSPVNHGLTFVLRSHNKDGDVGVQLYCTFSKFPYFNITEQDVPGGRCNYTVKLAQDSAA